MTVSTIHKLSYDVRCSLAEITRNDGTQWETANPPLEEPILNQAGSPISPIQILLRWAMESGFGTFADIVRREMEADPTRGFTRTIEVLGDEMSDDTFTTEAVPQAASSLRMLFEIEVIPGETIHSSAVGRA